MVVPHIKGRLLDIGCGLNELVRAYAGDGIGVDVTREAVKVLEAVASTWDLDLELVVKPWNADHYLETGETADLAGHGFDTPAEADVRALMTLGVRTGAIGVETSEMIHALFEAAGDFEADNGRRLEPADVSRIQIGTTLLSGLAIPLRSFGIVQRHASAFKVHKSEVGLRRGITLLGGQKIRIGPMSGKSNVVFWLESQQLPTDDALVDAILAAAKGLSYYLVDAEVPMRLSAWALSSNPDHMLA